jgi:hypothetical protein
MGLLRLRRDLSVSALRHSRQAHPPLHMLALREVHRLVARRPSAEPGDGEIGHQTLGDRTDFGCLREQPGKRQRAGQDKLGESPIRIDLNRLAQALDPMSHSPEIISATPMKKCQ